MTTTRSERLLVWLSVAAIIATIAFWSPGVRAQGVTRLCFAPASPVGNSCQDVTAANPLPIIGSISTTGFPTVQTTGTPISVTTGGVTGTLPTGAVVVATNVGTTNGAYCKLGASATTSDQFIAPNGGWFAFTVGASTQLTCITASSTTTVNMVGGSGLPTGTGGGGGSGGGGAITIASGAVASGAYSSGSVASGAFASGSVASGAFASGSLASGSMAAGSMVDLLTLRGTKAPGTAAANSLLAGCVYTAAGVTLSDGQQAACQFTSTGGILVSVANANPNNQATMANSSPVVIASNQTAIPVSRDATANSTTHGLYSNLLQGDAVISATNGIYSNTLQGNVVLSATNGLFSNLLQGNAVLSATNGLFANQLQGNAVLSATNGAFANILQGNAVLSVSNPSFARSVAGATGGGTISSAIAPATPAGANLKASAGTVLKVFATTIQTTPVYIKLYNASSAPTCGSGTPIARFMVPVAATAANGAGTNIDVGDIGAAFGAGIGYCVTGALADNDTTAITANNTLVNIVWN